MRSRIAESDRKRREQNGGAQKGNKPSIRRSAENPPGNAKNKRRGHQGNCQSGRARQRNQGSVHPKKQRNPQPAGADERFNHAGLRPAWSGGSVRLSAPRN